MGNEKSVNQEEVILTVCRNREMEREGTQTVFQMGHPTAYMKAKGSGAVENEK